MLTWETWARKCLDKNPTLDPRKWLEATVHQEVFDRGVREVGELLEGRSVPLAEFRVPHYSSDPEAMTELLDHLFFHGVQLGLQENSEWNQTRVLVMGREGLLDYSKPIDAYIGGQAEEKGVALCLASLEYTRQRTGVELDAWLADVLSKGS